MCVMPCQNAVGLFVYFQGKKILSFGFTEQSRLSVHACGSELNVIVKG